MKEAELRKNEEKIAELQESVGKEDKQLKQVIEKQELIVSA